MNLLIYLLLVTVVLSLLINLFFNNDELNFKTLKYFIPGGMISLGILLVFIFFL